MRRSRSVGVAGDRGRGRGAWKPSAAAAVGHVVHDAVGDEDGAGDALGRHVGEAGLERREQARAVARRRPASRTSMMRGSRHRAGGRRRRLQRLRATASVCAGAVAERLRGRAVDDDGDDVLQPLALLPHEATG